jgi:hypothetical protein
VSTVELISTSDQYGLPAGIDHLDHDQEAEIAELLVGHKVTKVSDDHLMLDDGTVLKLFGNDGGCACSAGCYDLTELNGVDNIITRVEVEAKPDDDSIFDGEPGTYRIFVFADNQKINLATFEGTDGNGYYGTGFHVLVRRPGGTA